MNSGLHYDAIIIGAGPAGLTAGIYLSRAKLSTLILNEGSVGGQMVLTHEIANYPGVESISGYQLASVMKKQAKTFGCDITSNVEISDMQLEGDTKQVELADGRIFTASTVIISTGGRARTLGVPGENRFKGHGISYCATCDGDFFTGKEIIVVGGGNSALEEAVSLTKYASRITIVHQFDHFQAFEHAVEDAQKNPKISFMMESVITGFYGNEKLESVSIKNLSNGESSEMKIDGVFIFIGYIPNTEKFKNLVTLNSAGEIVVDANMKTNIDGVFAAGDCIAKRYRQVTTAVGEGTIAALAASEYVHNQKKLQKQLQLSSVI